MEGNRVKKHRPAAHFLPKLSEGKESMRGVYIRKGYDELGGGVYIRVRYELGVGVDMRGGL